MNTHALAGRRLERLEDQPLRSEASNGLFVIPRGRGDGFEATIRGHILELADPDSGHALAPTPGDLFIASIASELAWSTRRFLRAYGLPGDVSVAARWQTHEGRPDDIDLTVTVSRSAEAVTAQLTAALERCLAARSLAGPVVHISLEGAKP